MQDLGQGARPSSHRVRFQGPTRVTFLRRIFRRGLAPQATHEKVREEPGPLTAHEAFELVHHAAIALDPKALLCLIQSGTDIRTDGRSLFWELLYRLPTKRARAILSLAPFEAANDAERAPIILHTQITAVSASDVVDGLPLPFRDSPEVVAELMAQGVDFVAGPSDLKLESHLRGPGVAVWLMRCWNDEFETDFSPKRR